jgi:hypothetical protein
MSHRARIDDECRRSLRALMNELRGLAAFQRGKKMEKEEEREGVL